MGSVRRAAPAPSREDTNGTLRPKGNAWLLGGHEGREATGAAITSSLSLLFSPGARASRCCVEVVVPAPCASRTFSAPVFFLELFTSDLDFQKISNGILEFQKILK
jgi:hypothetical protein